MLYNGYSNVTRWINENPEEFEEVMKEVNSIEDNKYRKSKFKENFSVTNLELFIDEDELSEIEIPF